ncbi:MAG: SRPBCC family protein [Solirubrobacteraceae bacterium]
MAPIITIVEIDRPPEVVFPYVIDPRTFPAWQPAVLEGALDREVCVGAICTTTRKIGGRAREIHSRITEYDPPHRWADHGIDGPIRGIVSVDVKPLDNRARSHVTIHVDFEGHGIGKALVPLVVRRQAAREMPANARRLKAAIEAS